MIYAEVFSWKSKLASETSKIGIATIAGAAFGSAVAGPYGTGVGAIAACVGSTCEKVATGAIYWQQREDARRQVPETQVIERG